MAAKFPNYRTMFEPLFCPIPTVSGFAYVEYVAVTGCRHLMSTWVPMYRRIWTDIFHRQYVCPLIITIPVALTQALFISAGQHSEEARIRRIRRALILSSKDTRGNPNPTQADQLSPNA